MVRIGHSLGVLALLAGPIHAQEQAAAQVAPVVLLLAEDEVDALVTRVALYPDPLLALVLQGSTLPIQAVQAARFVEKRVKDPSLQPDPTWDTSIIGLLNYPTVLTMMDDDLDWTERLGTAVVEQLQDVQASIQQIRSELQATGQGPHAPGGAYDYVINGHMVAGFALLAWPAEYGDTGVMSFLVGNDGVVLEADLGRRTEEIARATAAYDPTPSWRPVIE